MDLNELARQMLFTDNGGFGGRATPDTTHLQFGYAVAATNTGHANSSGTTIDVC